MLIDRLCTWRLIFVTHLNIKNVRLVQWFTNATSYCSLAPQKSMSIWKSPIPWAIRILFWHCISFWATACGDSCAKTIIACCWQQNKVEKQMRDKVNLWPKSLSAYILYEKVASMSACFKTSNVYRYGFNWESILKLANIRTRRQTGLIKRLLTDNIDRIDENVGNEASGEVCRTSVGLLVALENQPKLSNSLTKSFSSGGRSFNQQITWFAVSKTENNRSSLSSCAQLTSERKKKKQVLEKSEIKEVDLKKRF